MQICRSEKKKCLLWIRQKSADIRPEQQTNSALLLPGGEFAGTNAGCIPLTSPHHLPPPPTSSSPLLHSPFPRSPSTLLHLLALLLHSFSSLLLSLPPLYSNLLSSSSHHRSLSSPPLFTCATDHTQTRPRMNPNFLKCARVRICGHEHVKGSCSVPCADDYPEYISAPVFPCFFFLWVLLHLYIKPAVQISNI